MPHNRSARRQHLTSNYIKTTKGGTRYVRAIDVLRSEGGRKAIGALLADATEPDTPMADGPTTPDGARGTTSGHANAAAESNEDSDTTEVPVSRASSASR